MILAPDEKKSTRNAKGSKHSAAAIARRVEEIKAEEAQAEMDAAQKREENLRVRAEADVARRKILDEQKQKKALGDAAALRLQGGVWAEIHYAGQIIALDLSSESQTTRLTSVEAVRRAALAVANEHQNRVTASRAAGAVVPAKQIVDGLIQSDGGLRLADKCGALSIRSEM
jgi:hypothetical protein